ncbi:MAG: J domain-containing protein, partial [Nitrospinota bacterium]|nr:J domain-containing protein [Nitrospinota bacterium]
MQITKCYEVLQVESDAPWQVVKKSYYSLAKKLHPDLNSSN